jgi:DnaJ-domain-containing protein 1
MTAAFPLQWPDTLPRAKRRETGAFKTELPGALKNVETSLTLFGRDSGRPVTEIVLSSNVTLGSTNPADPGVAAWFKWDGEARCIAVDRYTTVKANLQAIHHVLEARRTELRHGTLALVRATFQGFKALPPPAGARDWPEVLSLPRTATKDEVEAAYRARAAKVHPDKGGTAEAFDELTRAKRLALRDLSQ